MGKRYLLSGWEIKFTNTGLKIIIKLKGLKLYSISKFESGFKGRMLKLSGADLTDLEWTDLLKYLMNF